MPSYHRTIAGLFVAGAAGEGGVISTNGGRVVLGPSAGGDFRVGAQWYKDTKAACQYFRSDLKPRLVAVDVVNGGEPELLWPDGTDKIVVGAGHWFAVTAHTGVRLDGELINYNVRAFAEDYMAWFPWNGMGLIVRGPNGDRPLSSTLGAEEVIQLFEDGGCAWSDGHPHVDSVVDYPTNPVTLDGGFGWFKIIKVRGEWWNVYQSYKLACVVAHPATKLIGNKWDAPAAFHLDVDHQTLEIIWSTTVADAPQNIVVKRIDPDNVVALEMMPPKIQKVTYDKLMKAGVPWQSTFYITTPSSITISKDDGDQYWIQAINEVGSDHTGVVRQLIVEGADKPLPPEPEMLGRYWFNPNVGSQDMLTMFRDFTGFEHVDTVELAIQHVLTDTTGGQIGENSYPNLVAANAFSQLKDYGISLVLGGGAVKNEDCTGQNYRNEIDTAIARVKDAGGDVAAFMMDEPITNSANCHLSLDMLADRTAQYVLRCRENGCDCGIAEAWPNISLSDLDKFIELLQVRGACPDIFQADIDWNRAKHEGKDPVKFIADCQRMCTQYGMVLALFVNSTIDPVSTEDEHFTNLQALTRKLHTIHPQAPQVVVAAWCRRTSTGQQDMPSNLTPKGLVASFIDTFNVFEATPLPPDPNPAPEDIVKFSKLLEGDPLAVKKILASSRGGFCVLVLPDFMGKADPTAPDAASHPDVLCHDYVFSMQPGGKPYYRKPGTDGLYEQGAVQSGLATFSPDGEFYTQKFVLVGE